eukprot:471364-Amphidinium_carterae.1
MLIRASACSSLQMRQNLKTLQFGAEDCAAPCVGSACVVRFETTAQPVQTRLRERDKQDIGMPPCRHG